MRAFLLIWGCLQTLDSSWSRICMHRQNYVCKELPTSYPADMSSLVLWVTNLGEINSTVFNNTQLSSVTSLTLKDTGITAIAPGSFDKFRNLKLINLNKNSLSQVTSAWFTHKAILSEIDLSDNSITALNDDAFLGLLELVRLNLSHNQIETVHSGTFHSLSKLSLLDLSNNKLSQLTVGALPPLNKTKILLNGNPWNCSDAEFSTYLRELHKASLLENEDDVLCDSPSCLRGVPVWNVSECVEPITTVKPTTGGSPTLPSQVQEINWAVVISLIVVLCALVVVICVLSVLYHRKQEQKHLQAIQPSPEEPESGNQAPSNCSKVLERSNLFKCDSKQKQSNYKTKFFLMMDQAVPDSEKVSQIYQIYGTGICQNREITSRAKSAGPVLSRAEMFGKTEMVVEVQQHPEVLEREKEVYAGWEKMEKETMEIKEENDVESLSWKAGRKKEQQGFNRDKEEEPYKMTRIEQKRPQNVNYEINATLETQVYKDDSQMESAEEKELGFKENFDFLHSDDDDDDGDDSVSNVDELKDNLTSSLARRVPAHPSNDIVQPSEDSEIIPYLTIGTDPESHNSNPEQIPVQVSTKQVPSRPIRRVLTWPPTAAQWKKQWVQNQQVLNVFPKLVFVAGCKYQNGTFPFNTSSSSSESIPPSHGSESVHKRPRDEVIDIDTREPLKESTLHSYIQNTPNLTEDYCEGKEGHTAIISHDPLLNSETCVDLSPKSPPSEELHSKANKKNSVTPNKHSEQVARRRKTDPTSMNEQRASKSERQSRRREKDGKKKYRGQRDQSSSGSRAPPSGGSPNDDTLLVDNEYAFIDLLHEVAENNGRWTRERWRQSHINKHKISGKRHQDHTG